jgi:hypothetical protein
MSLGPKFVSPTLVAEIKLGIEGMILDRIE